MILREEFGAYTEDYLRGMDWLYPNMEVYDYKKAGGGNMNFVVRVCTNRGNFIVKQSRPYVEKYPQIPAPIDRIAVEYAFSQKINQHPMLTGFSPKIKGFDPMFHIMAMEDLGYGSDFLGLYSGTVTISEAEIRLLVQYLIALHHLEAMPFPDNSAMKKLNHEHIFHFPYLEENGFNLDTIQPGLQSLAIPFKQDTELKKQIEKLGARYLAEGTTLLHGDFYTGSWLKVDQDIKVIDPEFAFVGDAEFDLGVMLAHFKLAGLDPNLVELTLSVYSDVRVPDQRLLDQYIGVEILRRSIGIAQLPLNLTLDQKLVLLTEARALILG